MVGFCEIKSALVPVPPKVSEARDTVTASIVVSVVIAPILVIFSFPAISVTLIWTFSLAYSVSVANSKLVVELGCAADQVVPPSVEYCHFEVASTSVTLTVKSFVMVSAFVPVPPRVSSAKATVAWSAVVSVTIWPILVIFSFPAISVTLIWTFSLAYSVSVANSKLVVELGCAADQVVPPSVE